MPTVIPPTVRHMILCDEVAHDPVRPGRVTIKGFIPQLRWPKETTTPLRLERIVALLILADGRGTGLGRIVCTSEETGMPIFQSGESEISFIGKDPSRPIGLTIVVRDCKFPIPGAYSVRLLFDDKPISQQPLIVR